MCNGAQYARWPTWPTQCAGHQLAVVAAQLRQYLMGAPASPDEFGDAVRHRVGNQRALALWNFQRGGGGVTSDGKASR